MTSADGPVLVVGRAADMPDVQRYGCRRRVSAAEEREMTVTTSRKRGARCSGHGIRQYDEYAGPRLGIASFEASGVEDGEDCVVAMHGTAHGLPHRLHLA